MTNEDLRRQVDTSDEWITTRTGICQRYYLSLIHICSCGLVGNSFSMALIPQYPLGCPCSQIVEIGRAHV